LSNWEGVISQSPNSLCMAAKICQNSTDIIYSQKCNKKLFGSKVTKWTRNKQIWNLIKLKCYFYFIMCNIDSTRIT
jgi:hypothetical protein